MSLLKKPRMTCFSAAESFDQSTTRPFCPSPTSTPEELERRAIIQRNDLLLHEAVIKNDTKGVQKILKEPVDVNCRNNYGRAPIHWASSRGNLDIMEMLMACNCDIEARDKYGMRPLLMAAWHGHRDAVHFLINTGACTNAINKKGYTILMCAARNNRIEVIDFLLDSLEDLKIDAVDNEGQTALFHAALGGHSIIVLRLIEKGAAIDIKNKDCQTALHVACERGHEEVTQLLLAHEADMEAKDVNENTPLHSAAQHQQTITVQILLDAGADPDSENEKGSTALHIASSLGSRGILELLIQHCANINKQNKAGNTPLHLACQANEIDIVETLISRGTDLNSLNTRLQSPIHIAAEMGYSDICKLLLAAGADIEQREQGGRTPLYIAARGSFTAIVDMIIRTARLDYPPQYQRNIFGLAFASEVLVFFTMRKPLKNSWIQLNSDKMENLNSIALENFKEYLQIPSVHPNIDYSDCVRFLTKIAGDLQLPIRVINVTPKNPVVVLTWKGTNPELPSILLNSHMDVVEVSEKDWKHKPFGAEIEDGKIYARGVQDMKSVGIQYLEAIRRMKLQNITCLRTVHVSFVPEEEVGKEGMELFVHTEAFKGMNVGLCMDEGYANETEKFTFLYGEKSCWQFTIHCKGQTGHGSTFLDNTPGEILVHVLEKFYGFRNEQIQKIRNGSLTEWDAIALNCTKASGGEQHNVIPNEMTATFDMRIPPTNSFEELEEMINKWCKEAGPDCFVEYHDKQEPSLDTKLDDSNIFWGAFKEASEEMNLELDIVRSIATSDSRYLRQLGIPTFGFSPMNNTKPLMHGNDEYLGVETFLNGIKIYCEIIQKLANVH